ncbi:MAG: FtsX-like permease family protein, partial [Pseudomonadota bacterium]
MTALGLSSRLLLRQTRSGSVWMLIAGLMVATAAIAAVSMFTDRIGRALEQQAGETLAADLVVASRTAIDEVFVAEAEQLSLDHSRMIMLSTVLFSDQDSRLFDVKGVTAGYPLRGTLFTADRLDGTDQATMDVPAAGTAWIEPRGLRILDIELGDRVYMGDHELVVDRLLTYEPDRGGGPFMLSPRLLVNLSDVQSSGLLGIGTQANHRLLLAGSEQSLAEYSDRVEPRLADRQRLVTANQADNQTSAALEQARRFLAVAALTAVILAAVAVLLSAIRFTRTQRDLIAVLKAFGASSSEILRALTLLLLWLVLIAVIGGAILGWFGQHAIAQILSAQMTLALPAPRWNVVLGSGLFTLLLAAGFALPPLLGLRKVPPMRILNRSLDRRPGLSRVGWLVPIAAALAIPVTQLNDLQLALLMLGGSAILALALAVSAWIAMRLTRLLARRSRGAWRFGLAGLSRREGASVLQITALGLGLMSLLLLMIVRGELIGQWQASLPEDSPDHFVVNLQPDQSSDFRAGLEAMSVRNLQMRPMANANLAAISGERPSRDRFTGQVNVSWIDQLPPANEVIDGAFWRPGDAGQVSLSERWADRVGVSVGDDMTFDAGGQTFTAEVTSIRRVDWNSFNVNFFILVTPEAADILPHQFIASFYRPDSAIEALDQLARSYPNASVLDVGALIQRVFDIISQVSRAAQVVFAFTLVAGLIVLLAALEATRDQRRSESALIRTLGAGNGTVQTGLLIEYSIMAMIAASLA